jgi:NAD(P)-dependent dehydrogenase (short-subunit alcohol dehydrogenase family)
MIANAGIAQVLPLSEVTPEDWDRMMAINARGIFLCYQAAAGRGAARSSVPRRSWRTGRSRCSGTERPSPENGRAAVAKVDEVSAAVTGELLSELSVGEQETLHRLLLKAFGEPPA